jgi:signal transduction histidine kinase
LRFVQAALAAGAPDEAIATWRAAHAGADEGVAVADLDARLALFLALEGGLEPAERVRAAVDLALATSRGVLVLPVAMRPGELDPRVEVVVERIASAAGEERAAVAMLLAASLARLRGETLVRLGQAPARCEGLAWSLAPAGDALLATRAADGGGCAGFRADPDAVRALLVEAAAPVLAAGIVLDVRDDSGLEPLRARHELVPGVLAFTVACADVDAWISRESARARYQSAGLVALAFLCAVAGVVAARALARERALAEARAAFVAGVSHELRTPIASILLLSENLEAGRATPESAARYYGLIRREALRLRQLVDTMLDFSRLERGQELAVAREPVDVAAWFASIADEARAWAATHALDLTVDARDLPASASIDREALRRALWNLLDNARKHSGARRVTLAARGERGALILEVTDAGRGVPRELRARVFEPFTRHAEPGVPGTGLGLALVRGIAGAHGGSIAVADAEGGGARFTLWIPVEEGEIA